MLAAGAFSSNAWATFPGVNGPIAYQASGGGVAPDVLTIVDPTKAASTQLTTASPANLDPAWSADGRRIAFTSTRDGNPEIYVMNADGTGQTRLTNNPAVDRDPAWSPDGSRIAFTSTRDGNEEVYVMNADGSGQTRLTDNPAADLQPDWSPDGTRIAFESFRDGNSEIYTMNPDGSGSTRLTVDPGVDADPSWSPDGRKIAFTAGSGRPAEIDTMNADGSGRQAVSPGGDSLQLPAWSPDGKEIVATDNSSKPSSLVILDVARRSFVPGIAVFTGVDPAWAPAPPPKPVPQVTKTANVGTLVGTVEVTVPAATAAVPLTDPVSLPVGTVVDATKGVAVLQTANAGERSTTVTAVSGGTATVEQQNRRAPLTIFNMAKPHCRGRGAQSARLHRRNKLHLHHQGKGHVGTLAGYILNAGHGTDWTTTYTCTRVVTKVTSGSVTVTDTRTGGHTLVRAGHEHVVRI